MSSEWWVLQFLVAKLSQEIRLEHDVETLSGIGHPPGKGHPGHSRPQIPASRIFHPLVRRRYSFCHASMENITTFQRSQFELR